MKKPMLMYDRWEDNLYVLDGGFGQCFKFGKFDELSEREKNDVRATLYSAIETLSMRERTAIVARYEVGMTYKQIGEYLGSCSDATKPITQERARQLLIRGIRKMRRSVSRIMNKRFDVDEKSRTEQPQTIEIFNFPPRIFNALVRANIYYLDDLMNLDYTSIEQIRNLGPMGVEHVMKAMERYNARNLAVIEWRKKFYSKNLKREFIKSAAIQIYPMYTDRPSQPIIVIGKTYEACIDRIDDFHTDAISQRDKNIDQCGFITSINRFVDRREAYIIARKCGQIHEDSFLHSHEELCPEDL